MEFATFRLVARCLNQLRYRVRRQFDLPTHTHTHVSIDRRIEVFISLRLKTFVSTQRHCILTAKSVVCLRCFYMSGSGIPLRKKQELSVIPRGTVLLCNGIDLIWINVTDTLSFLCKGRNESRKHYYYYYYYYYYVCQVIQVLLKCLH
jgi:hypothetical protein